VVYLSTPSLDPATPQKKNKPEAHPPDVAQPRPDQAPMSLSLSLSSSSTGTKSKGATVLNPAAAQAETETEAGRKSWLPIPYHPPWRLQSRSPSQEPPSFSLAGSHYITAGSSPLKKNAPVPLGPLAVEQRWTFSQLGRSRFGRWQQGCREGALHMCFFRGVLPDRTHDVWSGHDRFPERAACILFMPSRMLAVEHVVQKGVM